MEFNGLEEARQFIKPEIHPFLSHWLKHATPSEIKGLKLISRILKNEGKKLFRKPKNIPKPKKLFLSRESSYSTDFTPKNFRLTQAEIFKYKKLIDLPCSKILTPISSEILQNWISLNDEEKFQTLVLSTLRGILSSTKVMSTPFSTTHQDSYKWKMPELKKAVPQHPKKTVLEPILEKSKSVKVLHPTSHVFQTAKSIKAKYDHLNHDIIRSIDHVPTGLSSNYQDNYSTYFQTFPKIHKLDFHTSTSVKLLPAL